MLRVLGSCGLGIIFVAISPALRVSLVDDYDALETALQRNSPYSYIGVGLAILAGLMVCLHRASQPRC